MSRMFNRKSAVIAGVIAALIAAAGAYAYWTQAGSGSGTAATGTNVAITVTQTATPTGLYPGGPAFDLTGKFNNSNASKVYVHQVSATVSSVTRTQTAIDANLTCGPSDYQLNGFPVTIDAEINAGTAVGNWAGTVPVPVSIQLLDTSSNQDGCKGATANISYTSN
jgi:hypothetical protein